MLMPKLHVGYFEIPKKSKKKKNGNHSQRKASEHLIYSVSQLKKEKRKRYTLHEEGA